MVERWMAEVVAEMHMLNITAKEVAREVGWNPKYLSAILNGHYRSGVAEKKLQAAMKRIAAEKGKNTGSL